MLATAVPSEEHRTTPLRLYKPTQPFPVFCPTSRRYPNGGRFGGKRVQRLIKALAPTLRSLMTCRFRVPVARVMTGDGVKGQQRQVQ